MCSLGNRSKFERQWAHGVDLSIKPTRVAGQPLANARNQQTNTRRSKMNHDNARSLQLALVQTVLRSYPGLTKYEEMSYDEAATALRETHPQLSEFLWANVVAWDKLIEMEHAHEGYIVGADHDDSLGGTQCE